LKDEDVNKKLDDVDKKAGKTGKSIGGMESAFGSAGKMIASFGKTLIALAIGAGFNEMMKSAAEYGETIKLASEKTGMSMKSLQELKFVTSNLGVEFSSIQGTITTFTSKLKGADKDSNATAVALQRLGLSTDGLKNGTQSISELYTDVIKKLSGMANESDRNVMASALFGKKFSEILPILNAGSGEVQNLVDRYNKLGGAMSDDKIEALVAYEHATKNLKNSFASIGRTIAADLAPTLTDLANWFINNMPAIKKTIDDAINKFIVPVFVFFANAIKAIKENFEALMPIIVAAGAALAAYVVITKGALVIEALAKAWRIAAATLQLLAAGAKLSTVAQMALNKTWLASPITWIVAGVAALAAIVYLLVKNWDKAAPFFQSMWVVIRNAFDTGISAIVVAFRGMTLGLAKALDFVVGGIATFLSGFLNMLSQIPYVGAAFAQAQKGIDSFRTGLKDMVSNAQKDLNTANAGMKANANETSQAMGVMAKATAELGKGMGNTIGDTVNGIKNILKGGSKDIIKTTKETGDEAKTVVEEDANAAAQAAKDALDKQIKDLDSFGSAITKALKKRYDNQEKIESDALDKSLDKEKEAHNVKLKFYEDEYNAKLKALNADEESALNGLQTQIDAIKDMTEAEDKAQDERDYQKKIADLRDQITQAESNEDKISLQEELDKAIAEHEREALLDSRETQIKLLEQQMDDIREKARNEEDALKESYDLKKEAADNEYDLKVDSLNKEKDAVKAHYQALTDEEALQAEARKLVIGKDQKAIVDLLNTFAPGWQDAGMSFGESLVKGLNSAKQSVKDAVSGLLGTVPAGGSSGGNGSTGGGSGSGSNNGFVPAVTEADAIAQMQANSKAWANADAAERTRLNNENLNIGADLGWTKNPQTGVWYDENGKRAYAKGTDYAAPGRALVGEHGPELVEFHGGEKVTPNNKLGGTVINLSVSTDNPSDMRQAQRFGEAMVNRLRILGVNPQ
jgi:hypothetical protein